MILDSPVSNGTISIMAKKSAIVNQILAVGMLFFVLAWFLPANWSDSAVIVWGLTIAPALLLPIALLRLGKNWLFVLSGALLPALSFLTAGAALQLLPHTAWAWLAFVASALLLGLVLDAQIDIMQANLDSFVRSSLVLTLTSYALYLILAGAVRFAPWAPIFSSLVLFLVGGGFAVQILYLQTGAHDYDHWGWGAAFVASLVSLPLNFLPVNGLFYAATAGSLFYGLLTLSAARLDDLPWRSTLWRAIWLPALLLTAVGLLV